MKRVVACIYCLLCVHKEYSVLVLVYMLFNDTFAFLNDIQRRG